MIGKADNKEERSKGSRVHNDWLEKKNKGGWGNGM
jgi:hypothetical protein